MQKSNAEYLRLWFRDCPVVQSTVKMGLDYLSDSATEYAVFTMPSSIKARENVCGEIIPEEIQTEDYVFASKDHYGSSAAQNSSNQLFHQLIIGWILEQNKTGNFPEWNDGKVLSIVPTLTAAPILIGSSVAKYQIQLKVTYRRT